MSSSRPRVSRPHVGRQRVSDKSASDSRETTQATTRVVGKPFQKGNPGRPKGAVHRFTIARALQEQQSGRVMPLDFALLVMRDEEEELAFRLRACEMAFPYLHRKMPIAIETMDKTKYGSFTPEQLRALPESVLASLLSASVKYHRDLAAIGIVEPLGNTYNVEEFIREKEEKA